MAPGLPSSAGLCVSCWALPLLSPILQHQLQQRQRGEAGAVLALCRAQGQGGRLGAEEAWLCLRIGGGCTWDGSVQLLPRAAEAPWHRAATLLRAAGWGDGHAGGSSNKAFPAQQRRGGDYKLRLRRALNIEPGSSHT